MIQPDICFLVSSNPFPRVQGEKPRPEGTRLWEGEAAVGTEHRLPHRSFSPALILFVTK